jgi:hypothetical protein
LAQARRRPSHRPSRGGEIGSRDDGPHPASLPAAGSRALRLRGEEGECRRGGAADGDHAEGQAQRAHLGYWIGTPSWGQGYATEAARALIDAFFAYTEAQELTSSARVINPPSRRVLEKCGFAHEGSGLLPFPARGGVFPVEHFRLDRRMWQSLKSWSHTGYVPHGPATNGSELAQALQ